MKVAPVPFYISLEVPENLSVLFEQKISVLHMGYNQYNIPLSIATGSSVPILASIFVLSLAALRI